MPNFVIDVITAAQDTWLVYPVIGTDHFKDLTKRDGDRLETSYE